MTQSVVTFSAHWRMLWAKRRCFPMFGDKLKKLRTDNQMTQDELKESLNARGGRRPPR